MRRIITIATLAFVSVFIFAEGVQEAPCYATQEPVKEAKYVFLFIGDGTALPQINATEAFIRTQRTKEGFGVDQLAFTKFPNSGMTTTFCTNHFITDSAAAATAIAAGTKTYKGAISVNENKQPVETIAEIAHDKGFSVGLVSTTRLTHATPAAFASHHEKRGAENDIAVQMSKSGFEYMAGGGYRHFVPADGEYKSKRKDNRNLYEEMAANSYKTFISDDASGRTEGYDAFMKYIPSPGDKVVATFNYGHLNYDLDRINLGVKEPSLAEMTEKGIELLSYDEDGFFMMVEGGRIDHACHINDAMGAIQDALAFNEAVEEAVDFYNAHPDETVIIVTGDHETGGMSLGFNSTGYDAHFDQLASQKTTSTRFEKVYLPELKEKMSRKAAEDFLADYFGLTDFTDEEMAILEAAAEKSFDGEKFYGKYDSFVMAVTHLKNNRAGLSWSSTFHTGVPVATFSIGVGSEAFNGYYDNTDIFKKMKTIIGE